MEATSAPSAADRAEEPIRAPDGTTLWRATGRHPNDGTPWIALSLLVALAAVLRLLTLGHGLWWDEIRTLVDSVRLPLWQIVTVFPGDNQHTLFSILAHLSISIFGESEWSLRLPAALFGIATVPLLYGCAREFVGRTEALVASLLLTVSYHHVWFSQSARGYALLAFFTVLCTWLLLRGLRSNGRSYFLWYGIVAAAAIYTHVTMVFLVVSHAALCALPLGLPWPPRLAWPRWRGPLTGFVLAGALGLALNLPFLLEVRQAVVDAPSPMQAATPKWALLELIRGMQLGLGGLIGAVAGAALFGIGSWSYLRQSRFLIGLFLVPGALTLAANIVLHRPVRPRFVFFLAGFLVLIVVRGVLEVGRWLQHRRAATAPHITATGIGLALLLAAASASALGPNYRYPKQDFVAAMAYVDAHAAPGDAVVTAGGARYPYREYFRREWEGLETVERLAELRGQGTSVWVVHTMDSYIRANSPALLAILESECSSSERFRGTVADGDVTVCKLNSTRATPNAPTPDAKPGVP
jgi:4-amino-4-deoxy-L-arabinose transferase-like glycosyltransferase